MRNFLDSLMFFVFVFLGLVVTLLFFVFLGIPIFVFLSIYMISRGAAKMQNLSMFFINKSWVDICDYARSTDLNSLELDFLTRILLEKDDIQVRFTLSKDFLKDIKGFSHEEFAIKSTSYFYLLPIAFPLGFIFSSNRGFGEIIFQDSKQDPILLTIDGLEYFEHVVEGQHLFSSKKAFFLQAFKVFKICGG